MKNLHKFSAFLLVGAVFFGSCKKDDHDHNHAHEQELITKVVVRFSSGAETVTMTWEDTDGLGSNPPVIQNGKLKPNTTYDIDISIAGEGGKDITAEITNEADEHQVYYGFPSTLFNSFQYTDQDSKGKPLGLRAKVTTIPNTGGGNLQILLVHEPIKSQNLASTPWVYNPNIGGEQDFNITFNVTVAP
ncbi:hypothetical protein [Raineya orbicola]|jgi:hypothetical protein|uniref:Type 1 periplasmic binding fold superfamily protein n=1 Tax=Raineya orbicola TaxID=2016530 RepID=A0A2N3I9V7_9BACT|nr:hypothetical protein [Raineya orbicola]PKQ67070.1 hypothetical protein Rain11_2175 [Raineya orbicola]